MNNTNHDPEQFEYLVLSFKEIQARFEPTIFSNSYIHTSSSSPAICSICVKSQSNFQSLICNHAFCHDCWTQYIEMKFQSHNYLSKNEKIFILKICLNQNLDIECMKCDVRIPQK